MMSACLCNFRPPGGSSMEMSGTWNENDKVRNDYECDWKLSNYRGDSLRHLCIIHKKLQL